MPNLTGKKNLQNFGITHYFNLSHELIMWFTIQKIAIQGVFTSKLKRGNVRNEIPGGIPLVLDKN